MNPTQQKTYVPKCSARLVEFPDGGSIDLRRKLLIERNFKHGFAANKGREYNAWQHAKARCFNPNCEKYHLYGGRGITMCGEWAASFPAFLAALGPCPKGFWLDRIDSNKGYEPGNTRWASVKTQQNNKRSNHMITVDGATKTLSQWAELMGVRSNLINLRIRAGWDAKRAVFTPPDLRFGPKRNKQQCQAITK